MSMLDSALDWLDETWTDVQIGIGDAIGPVIDAGIDEWNKQVENLKVKARQFAEIYNKLLSDEDFVKKYPQLADEYESLMTKGQYLKATVQKITNAIDWGSNLFDNTSNLNGINGLKGLGVVQVIPIVVIAGAVTALGYFINDAYTLSKKIDTMKEMEARGHDPVAIGKVLNNNWSDIFSMQGLFSVTGLIMLGVATYTFWPNIQKVLKKLK